MTYIAKANQLTFLDSRFYKTQEGGYVPSVTYVLDCYPKGAQFYEWLKKAGVNADEIRDDAGRRGSAVHLLAEEYDFGKNVRLMDDNGNINYKIVEWAMFERYVDFRQRHPLTMEAIETTIVSQKLGYAGTIDRVVYLNGKLLIVDLKTSNAMHQTYWLQLAAYRELLKTTGVEVDDVAILWLNSKTRTYGKKGDVQGPGWQLIRRGDKDAKKDLKLFNITRTLWEAENGDVVPRETIYTLTHQLETIK